MVLRTTAIQLVTRLAQAAGTLVLACVLGAALVSMAPGTGVDERELSAGLGPAAIAEIRRERAQDREFLRFLPKFALGAVRGDFGQSGAFQQPVAALIGERLPLTLRIAAEGLGLAWICGLAVALAVAMARPVWLGAVAAGVSGALLCLPAGLVAIALAVWKLPASLGIAAGVFPKIYGYAAAMLKEQASSMHLLGARARGVGVVRLIGAHLLLPSARPLAALGAVSLVAALGLAVPMEALSDTPGIGQLALRATLARDVRLLVGLTLAVTAIALVANLVADLVREDVR